MGEIISDTDISSILNFRDAGGLRTTGGGTMRKGLIYRSANPDRVNEKDLRKMTGLGIKTIIDLRDPSEFSKRRAEFRGISIINIPLNFENKTRQRLKPLLKRNFDPDGINRVTNGINIEILDALGPVLGKTVELILQPDNTPLLIHCQAGKDRTGILSALLQMIAGVERDEIIRDYLTSNDSILPHFKKRLRIRKYLTLGLFPSEAVLHAIRQKQEDMVSVLDRVNNHYGGIEKYLSGAGFDASQINKLRDILAEN